MKNSMLSTALCSTCRNILAQSPSPPKLSDSDNPPDHPRKTVIHKSHTFSTLEKHRSTCPLCSRIYLAFGLVDSCRLKNLGESIIIITLYYASGNALILLDAEPENEPLNSSFKVYFYLEKQKLGEHESHAIFEEIRPTSGEPESISKLKFAKARMWLKTCDDEHLHCRNLKLSLAKLPTRLISVGSQDSQICLCYSASFSSECDRRYMTLSHCWGKLVFTVLRTSNHDEFLEKIPEQELTKTFRDAVHVCRSLGIPYIWIDSLCIIQDSPGDWHKEAATMHLVYSNSYLNLAASASPNGSWGLFRDYNPALTVPCVISAPNSGTYIVDDRALFVAEFENSPLHSRGWVVQELFLSPRTLHFTNEQQWWQCKDAVLSKYRHYYDRLDVHPIPRCTYSFIESRWVSQKATGAVEQVAHKDWERMVEDYSQTELTYVSDRIVALTGLKEEFTQRFFKAGKPQEYIAGHWTNYMISELLWMREGTKIKMPAPLIAPTWSWLSINGPIRFDNDCHSNDKQYSTFIRAITIPQHAAGSNEDNHWSALQLTGLLFQLCSDGTKYYTFHQDSKFELGISLYFDDDRVLSSTLSHTCAIFRGASRSAFGSLDIYRGLILEERPSIGVPDIRDMPLYRRRGWFNIVYDREKDINEISIKFHDIIREKEIRAQGFWLY